MRVKFNVFMALRSPMQIYGLDTKKMNESACSVKLDINQIGA